MLYYLRPKAGTSEKNSKPGFLLVSWYFYYYFALLYEELTASEQFLYMSHLLRITSKVHIIALYVMRMSEATPTFTHTNALCARDFTLCKINDVIHDTPGQA